MICFGNLVRPKLRSRIQKFLQRNWPSWKLVDAGRILTNAAKEIFIEMFATGDSGEVIADRRGLKVASTDSGEVEQWCRDSIAANPKALAEFKAGKDTAINAFKGPVMKAAKGKANPKVVDETLRRLLAAT